MSLVSQIERNVPLIALIALDWAAADLPVIDDYLAMAVYIEKGI